MDIRFEHVSKAFDQDLIFEDFSAVIPEGAITGIAGPSGIGKTTLLRMIAGLVKPDDGVLSGLPQGGLSYVFQENRLLPWLDVRQNITFVLKTDEELARVDGILKMVGLTRAARQRPATLSGGMGKRVALARAFCKDSQLMLMDEPFTGLDTELKDQIIADFLALWQQDRRTVVLVSHDEDELARCCSHLIRLG